MKIKKIIFTITLSFTFVLTGCSEKKAEYSGEYPMSEEERNEITPLEKEISELKDFQITDKVYDNKDLEPYNKIQGYLYETTEGLDTVEVIELIPPERKKELEDYWGDKYKFVKNVIVPTYFMYFEVTDNWEKIYAPFMNSENILEYKTAPSEYKFISDEELNKVFGNEKSNKEYQFKLTN